MNGRRALPSCTVALDPHPRDKPQASLNGAGGMHMNAQTDANFIGVASERGERICDERGAGMMMSEPWRSIEHARAQRHQMRRRPHVSGEVAAHSTPCSAAPQSRLHGMASELAAHQRFPAPCLWCEYIALRGRIS